MPRPLLPTGLRLPRAGLRRDLWISTADAVAYAVMVGCGETYLPAFALALGLGPVAAGMMASVPILFGAVMQLVTPFGVARLGSNRAWVIACTVIQALSFVPLVWWALRGEARLGELLAAAGVYWSAGMAGSPAWNSWIGTLVPRGTRTAFFAQRNRLTQFGIFVGFVLGGLLLQLGESCGFVLQAFAALFVVAALFRLLSTACLCACREPKPPQPAAAAATSLPVRIVRACRAIAARPSGALVGFLCGFVFGAQFAAPYFTPYMIDEMGFSYHAFMLVVATSFLAKAATLPILGRLASRIGSLGLMWAAVLAIVPLSLLWLPSANVAYLVGVQVLAGTCWAAYELSVSLSFFDAVDDAERTTTVTVYNLGLALATVTGAACGGLLLRTLGEDRTAYAAVFAASAVLRLAALPLLQVLSRRLATPLRAPD